MIVTDEMVEAALAAYVKSRGTYEREVAADEEDIRAALRAAIALMRGQSWQDIATAPKDGTSVLLFLPGKEASWPDSQCTAYWHEQNERWCLLETGAHALDGDVWPQPTHWQPLPTPPKDTADE